MLTRDEAAKKLGSLGAEYQNNPNAETLKAVQHQALLLLNLDPARSSEALALLKEILTSNPQPPSASPTPESKPMPASESERRYPKFSEVERDNFLTDWKKELDQGLLGPSVKPSFLGIDPGRFVGSQHTFEGNPLPEFCSISRNILDCFATALLSTPDLEFPASPLVVRCRLGEERKNLSLNLIAMLAVGEQILPLELKEEWEVWIASKLRPLAKAKEIALANIFWDRARRHSFFFFDYPGKMVRDKVPGLGALGENGKPCWPKCELLVDPVTATLRETARRAIDFVESTTESPIQ